MIPPIELLANYLHLARAAELRRQMLVRDRVLLLAAVTAVHLRLPVIAAACRERVLTHNPRHLIGRWPTVAAALETEEFQSLVRQIAMRYAPERVEQLLTQLGIERGRERATYASDGEYAAALLGADWDDLCRRYRADPGGETA